MFSQSYKRFALVVLTAVYMLNLVDRGLMGLMLEPIKKDLHLSDTQLGFVTGIAFGLFYAVLGLPIARWADRNNRVTITALAIGLWGLTVMASIFVSNFVQLVFARMAAAIGESGCKPPTYSLVGDYFPQPAERTGAMAIYIAGAQLSTLLSYMVGGWLNELYGWRMTFFLMGILGVLLAVVVKLAIVEPRTQPERASIPRPPAPSMREVATTLWRQRSFRHLSIALVLFYTMGVGLGPWQAVFMIRLHGMGTGELGLWLGLITSICGIAGALSGGYVAARWFADDERGQMRLSAMAVASIVPIYLAFLTLPHRHQALIALIPLTIAFSIFLGPMYALMQRLVRDEMRATTMALVMLLANLIGFGVGPQIVGILSDVLTPAFGTNALRYAMMSMSLVALWSAYHFWHVGETVTTDLSIIGRGTQIGSESTMPPELAAESRSQ